MPQFWKPSAQPHLSEVYEAAVWPHNIDVFAAAASQYFTTNRHYILPLTCLIIFPKEARGLYIAMKLWHGTCQPLFEAKALQCLSLEPLRDISDLIPSHTVYHSWNHQQRCTNPTLRYVLYTSQRLFQFICSFQSSKELNQH